MITNAKTGWVEYSSYYLLPRVHQMITEYIPVISAQNEFSDKYPTKVPKWKKLTFM
jgi:hypothetical protein